MPAPRARLAAWATALGVLIAPDLALADIPIGSFEFELGGVNSLWMGGGEDTHEDADGFCASFGQSFDVVETCSFRLTVDGRGKLGGYVSFTGLLAGNRIAVEGPIKGAQRGDNRSGITRVSFQVPLAGSASRGGAVLGTNVDLTFDGQLDAGGVLNGAWTQSVCYEGFACTPSQSSAGPIPWNDGHWTLRLDVELLAGGSLGGNAQIGFGDDTTCDFALRGRYDASVDAASLSLSPTSPQCTGGSLRLRSLTRPAGGHGERYRAELQYKLFGVRGTTVVDTEAAALDRLLLEPPRDPNVNAAQQAVIRGSSNGSSFVIILILGGPAPSFASQSASASSVSVAASGMRLNLASPAPVAAGAGLTVSAMVGFAPLQPFRPGAAVLGQPGVVPLAP